MKPRILVVDDQVQQIVAHKTTITIVARELNEDYEIVSAQSIEEAYQYFNDTNRLPSLVIIDMHLPRKSSGPDPEFCEYGGYKLLRSITKEHPNIWWLVASGQPLLNQIIIEDEGRSLLTALNSYSNVLAIWYKLEEGELRSILEQYLSLDAQSRNPQDSRPIEAVRETIDNEIFIAASAESSNIYNRIWMLSAGIQPLLLVGGKGTGKELTAKLLAKIARERKKKTSDESNKVPGTVDLITMDAGDLTYNLMKDALEDIGAGYLYIRDLDKTEKSLQDDLVRNVISLKKYPVRLLFGVECPLSVFNPSMVSNTVYLNSLILALPTLKERQDEIIRLVEVFLEQHNRRFETGKHLVQKQQLASMLRKCQWPNNLDDLRLLTEQAATMTLNPAIGLEQVREAAVQRRLLRHEDP